MRLRKGLEVEIRKVSGRDWRKYVLQKDIRPKKVAKIGQTRFFREAGYFICLPAPVCVASQASLHLTAHKETR